MLRHVFYIYASRSRDSAGLYGLGTTARDRKTVTKVACFAFWRTRRCVRTYTWPKKRFEFYLANEKPSGKSYAEKVAD